MLSLKIILVGSTYTQLSNIAAIKNFNEEAFCMELSQIPWKSIDALKDVNDALNAWYKLLLDVVDKHLPWREKRVKKQKQPDPKGMDSNRSMIC